MKNKMFLMLAVLSTVALGCRRRNEARSCGNLDIRLAPAAQLECRPSGYITGDWNNTGVWHGSSPGVDSCDTISPTGSLIIATALCGTVGWNERDWSPFAGQLASAAGVSSIMLSGVEMSGIARICRDTYSTGGWRIVIPNNAAARTWLASSCPYPLP